MFSGSYSILARWGNYVYFSQLLNARGVSEVIQTEEHAIEPVVPEPSAFEFELAIANLKSHKSQGIDQIPAEFIKEGGRSICYAIIILII